MTDKLKKLINLAAHPSTADSEALAAIRQLGRVIDKHPLGLDALFRGTSLTPTMPLSFNAANREKRELETKVEQLESENTDLHTAVEKLHAEIASRDATIEALRNAAKDRLGRAREDGSMPYDEFSFRVGRFFGGKWGTAFQEQTGFTAQQVDRWRQNGVAPAEAVAAISELSVPVETVLWTPEEVAIIRRLAKTCSTYGELAQEATKEISKKVRERVVSPNQMRELVVSSQNRTGLFLRPGYGGSVPISLRTKKTERKTKTESSGRPTGKKRGPKPKFDWTKYPEEELYLARSLIGERPRMSLPQMGKWLTKKTGIEVNHENVKSRFYRKPLPTSLANEVTTTGEPTWKELWYLGSHFIGADHSSWNSAVWSFLGMEPTQIGHPLDIPKDKMEALRRKARKNYSDREAALEHVRNAGRLGISVSNLQRKLAHQGRMLRVADLLSTEMVVRDGDRLWGTIAAPRRVKVSA